MSRKSYHLRWNNHLQNLQNLFETLYNEQSLIDVTVSCSDGLLYGHKLVLTACSPYFEKIFKDNPCKHPVIILKGIHKKNMQLMLQYMYTGSIDVAEEDLDGLLDAASDLQIKGLGQSTAPKTQMAQNSNGDRLSNNITSKSCIKEEFTPISASQPVSDTRCQTKASGKTLDPQYQQTIENMLDCNEPMDDQEEKNDDEMEDPVPQFLKIDNLSDYGQEISEDDSKDFSLEESIEEPTEIVQNNNCFPDEGQPVKEDDITYFCHICARGFLNKNSYHRHMLTHAGVKPHSCTFCSQSFLRLSHLQRHIRVHTGERPYSCGICSKPFSRSDKLRQHYIIQHNTDTPRVYKPRGRPRKQGMSELAATPLVPKVPRPRGRPRKHNLNEPNTPVVPKIPRPRGRPRKDHQFYPPVSSDSLPTIDSVYSMDASMNGSVPVPVPVNGLHQPVTL